jgi:hypothetical protein
MLDNKDFSENFGEPDEVPYAQTCSCHPSNGGSGICGCVMANRMVPNPKKYGYPKTNFTTTTDFVININQEEYNKEVEKRDVEEIIETNRKINILSSLISIVDNDHPEFEEEHTTGWDLLENARLWLEELKNKK